MLASRPRTIHRGLWSEDAPVHNAVIQGIRGSSFRSSHDLESFRSLQAMAISSIQPFDKIVSLVWVQVSMPSASRMFEDARPGATR